MGDRQPTVAADVQEVKQIDENMGLTLNVGKCELFCHRNTSIADPYCCSLSVFRRSRLLTKPLFSALHVSSGLSWTMRGRRDWLI